MFPFKNAFVEKVAIGVACVLWIISRIGNLFQNEEKINYIYV